MLKRLTAKTNNQRQRAVVNLKQAQTVGILFLANKQVQVKQVKELVDYLKSFGIQAKALGYAPQKDLDNWHKTNLIFDYYTQKQCNWYGRPKGTAVDHFTQEPFDFLIDLSLRERPALKFVSSMSMAKLKVGIAQLGTADLMIDIGKKGDLDYFIKELKHYLNLINN